MRPETVQIPVVSLVNSTTNPLFEVALDAKAGLVGVFAPGLLNVIA